MSDQLELLFINRSPQLCKLVAEATELAGIPCFTASTWQDLSTFVPQGKVLAIVDSLLLSKPSSQEVLYPRNLVLALTELLPPDAIILGASSRVFNVFDGLLPESNLWDTLHLPFGSLLDEILCPQTLDSIATVESIKNNFEKREEDLTMRLRSC